MTKRVTYQCGVHFFRMLSRSSNIESWSLAYLFVSLVFTLTSCGAVHCNRSCLWVCLPCVTEGSVRTLLQPARAQCLRLSERFFHLSLESTPVKHACYLDGLLVTKSHLIDLYVKRYGPSRGSKEIWEHWAPPFE